MNTIKNILFPTDFSDTAQNAFRYCLKLADVYEADIRLLHVIYPEYEALDLPVMAAQATKEKAEAAKSVSKEFVELALTQLQTTDQLRNMPVIHSEVEIGTPSNIIVDVARRESADLIVMGTKGEHNALERLWGSVTTAVIEKAHCHVWVVPEHAAYAEIDVAAFATDLNEADPYHIWEYGKLLEPFHPVLHCVHVDEERSVEHTMNFASLGSFFEHRAPALQINFHTLSGKSISTALEDFTEQLDIDLLAMYAPQHNWFSRLFQRSETQAMAFKTKVPLLLLKH
jgi:nucleotide-binding universal stress UspA family protein